MIFRWRLQAPQTMLWCHRAYNRGSGRSRRGHWATSDTLRSLQGPDRGLRRRIAHGLRGRGDVEANNIGGFGGKIRVVALAPCLASREVHLVAAQEAPDILDVNIAQRLGQYTAAPARKPLRRQLVQQLRNPLVGGLRIDRLLARTRIVLQLFKAMIGMVVPPNADNPRLGSDFFRAGATPSAANRTVRARFKSRCNVTGERQHASSTLRSFREGGLLLLRSSIS